MTYSRVALFTAIVVLLATCGCVRAAHDTTAFAISDSAVADAAFEETWQAVKHVLRDMDLDIYTRDKRGVFVAFTKMRRKLLVPHRTRLTVSIEETGQSSTAVSVETVRQVYGVTLLTYPGWHDRRTSDHAHALAILEALEAKLSGQQAAAG